MKDLEQNTTLIGQTKDEGMGDLNTKNDNKKYISVYGEIAQVLSNPADVERVYELLKGQTVSFPQKLYSKEYMKEYINRNYGNETAREIASVLGISDRRVRQIANEREQVQGKDFVAYGGFENRILEVLGYANEKELF